MFMPPVREFSNAIINPPSRYKRPKAPYKYRKNKYLDKGESYSAAARGRVCGPFAMFAHSPCASMTYPLLPSALSRKPSYGGRSDLG